MNNIKKINFQMHTLLVGIVEGGDKETTEITGLTSDSRAVQAGDLFIAHAATIEAHDEYIAEAIKKGAAAVLREAQPHIPNLTHQTIEDRTIPILAVPSLREKVGIIAARYYGDPSKDLFTIGVTGTNGKTSICQFIAQALQNSNRPCGIVGTLGSGFPDNIKPGMLTTPDATDLQKTIFSLKEASAKYITMEASSHSLAQHRTTGMEFNIGVFTNLTQDHLDYHGDMEHYYQAKRQLFSEYPLQYAVINADDEYGQRLLDEFADSIPCYAFTTGEAQSQAPTISAKNIKLNMHGMSALIETPWGSGQLKTGLLGRFNLSNLLATITVLGLIGLSIEEILTQVAALNTVPGRMQTLGGGKLPLVVVDYAHTPDALEKALISLKEHVHAKLWCVFGCGGDRDKLKRRLMGETAERYSDQIIITDDNPRHENPEAITEEILKGLLCPWAVEVEHDRQTAIAHAIDCAEAGDVVLIAGKGHETFQQIGEEKVPFSDVEQVLSHLTGKKKVT